MPRAVANKWETLPIEIEYDTFGDKNNPALILVMGFGAQMVAWDTKFAQMLADRGHFVVRFDNRDVGLSTKLDGVKVDANAVVAAALLEQPLPPVPYNLSDMAQDIVGLMDHLNIAKAHIMGASMGGMIAQVFAIEHPQRTASLVSVMSMPGEPETMQSEPEAMTALMSIPPSDRTGFIEHSLVYQAFQSKKYRNDALSRANAARDFDRSFYPEGSPRQMAAIYASGRRTEALAALKTRTLVVHGNDDTLIPPSAGQRTADIIPGAEIVFVDDMGHDIPEPLWPKIVDTITRFTLKK
ncbi:MAG: alpha/beta fold hydrolase [Actinobacteria bacterium]|nr:alpha/beta fold hydrolase [Actinomycetota bacterium]MBM3816192.1 alpha/beta fold hydrolase [Actinomycetota bacterium]